MTISNTHGRIGKTILIFWHVPTSLCSPSEMEEGCAYPHPSAGKSKPCLLIDVEVNTKQFKASH